MFARRRVLNWLALLAVLLYGLAPCAAALLPRPPTPLACSAESAHACACRPDPHEKGDCCCNPGRRDNRCQASSRPCDNGEAPAAAVSVARSPMQLPQHAPASAPVLLTVTGVLAAQKSSRLSAVRILTPPPRA